MRAVDVLFDELVRRGGTDLHVAPQHPPLARVRGELTHLRETALSARDVEEMLLELVGPRQQARLATSLDATFSVAHDGGLRFRARYYMSRSGLAAVFRLIPARLPSTSGFVIPNAVRRLADSGGGLLVIAGNAASGKSTTAAWLVDRLNDSRACHVVTLEDPIEFVHEHKRAMVTQREVGLHVPSLLSGLTNCLREDVDVLVAPDVRAEREVDLVLELAEDGVLVIVTVEASSIALALDRLVSAAPPERRSHVRARLADCLVGTVLQERARGEDGALRYVARES